MAQLHYVLQTLIYFEHANADASCDLLKAESQAGFILLQSEEVQLQSCAARRAVTASQYSQVTSCNDDNVQPTVPRLMSTLPDRLMRAPPIGVYKTCTRVAQGARRMLASPHDGEASSTAAFTNESQQQANAKGSKTAAQLALAALAVSSFLKLVCHCSRPEHSTVDAAFLSRVGAQKRACVIRTCKHLPSLADLSGFCKTPPGLLPSSTGSAATGLAEQASLHKSC